MLLEEEYGVPGENPQCKVETFVSKVPTFIYFFISQLRHVGKNGTVCCCLGLFDKFNGIQVSFAVALLYSQEIFNCSVCSMSR